MTVVNGSLDDMSEQTEPKSFTRRVSGSVWFHLIAAFVVVGLISTFVGKLGYVTSGSMEATLNVRDRVVVDRVTYAFKPPAAGDVIVFDAGADWVGQPAPSKNPLRLAVQWFGELTGIGPSGPNTMIKRIIGQAGQTVSCCDEAGAIVVDGQSLSEPYVYEDFAFEPGVLDCSTANRSARCFDAVTVPPESFLVLGDHRSRSADSASNCRYASAPAECWRWAPRDGIVGRALLVFWPLGRFGAIE